MREKLRECRVTIVVGGVIRAALGVRPRLDADEVGDEGGNLALDHHGVAPDHVLVLRLRLVVLRHHWCGVWRRGQ